LEAKESLRMKWCRRIRLTEGAVIQAPYENQALTLFGGKG
jgi:hypothetical protein